MLGRRQWKLLGSGIIPWYNRNEGRCTISTGLNGGFKYGSPCHTRHPPCTDTKAFAEKQTKSKNEKKKPLYRVCFPNSSESPAVKTNKFQPGYLGSLFRLWGYIFLAARDVYASSR